MVSGGPRRSYTKVSLEFGFDDRRSCRSRAQLKPTSHPTAGARNEAWICNRLGSILIGQYRHGEIGGPHREQFRNGIYNTFASSSHLTMREQLRQYALDALLEYINALIPSPTDLEVKWRVQQIQISCTWARSEINPLALWKVMVQPDLIQDMMRCDTQARLQLYCDDDLSKFRQGCCAITRCSWTSPT